MHSDIGLQLCTHSGVSLSHIYSLAIPSKLSLYCLNSRVGDLELTLERQGAGLFVCRDGGHSVRQLRTCILAIKKAPRL